MKTYHIINKSDRDSHSELKHYTFEQLKAQFEPDASIKEDEPEARESWNAITDIWDLEEWLKEQAAGMAQPIEFAEDCRNTELANLTNGTYTDDEVNAILDLLESLDMDASDKLVLTNLDGDYISINTGRDGYTYAWYADESRNKAIRVKDLAALSESEIERILM